MNKRIKFSANLVPLIITGEKDNTWRINDEKQLSVGDHCDFVNAKNGEVFGQADLLDVVEKTFLELTEEDQKGHEKFASQELMYETYSKYYNSPIDGSTKLKIIKFKFSI